MAQQPAGLICKLSVDLSSDTCTRAPQPAGRSCRRAGCDAAGGSQDSHALRSHCWARQQEPLLPWPRVAAATVQMRSTIAAMLLAYAVGPCAAKTGLADLNQWLVKAEYAVRGEILDRSAEFQKRLDSGEELPFKKIIACNIGNPQSLGQKPLTFNRQVLSLVTNPELMTNPVGRTLFPGDVVERAENYLANMKGGLGAYSHSQGIKVVREEVAQFITERDGVGPADPEQIFLTDGASAGVRMVYTTMIESHKGTDGILVPIPQYPLYSALTTLHNARLVPYYLDEKAGWKLTVTELQRALAEAKKAGTRVRALAVINPGNPTGQCLTEADMRGILKLCAQEGMVLLADEVYQENVYTQARNFVSFRKVRQQSVCMGMVLRGITRDGSPVRWRCTRLLCRWLLLTPPPTTSLRPLPSR
jgi:aspartate/methionine/tyrosine aminotransferase